MKRKASIWSHVLAVLIAAPFVLAPMAPGITAAQVPSATIEDAKAFTVRVVTLKSGGESGTGTGFYLTEEGHVATNQHVIEGGEKLWVLFVGGRALHWAEAEIVAQEEAHDVAILKTEFFPGARTATLVLRPPADGDSVFAVGYPGALDAGPELPDLFAEGPPSGRGSLPLDEAGADNNSPKPFMGNVGGRPRAVLPGHGEGTAPTKQILHDAKTSGGNSGGPLVDTGGRVVGIDTYIRVVRGATYHFAVQASHIGELASRSGVRASVTFAPPPAGPREIPIGLIAAVGALSVVTFLMALRKPRAVLVRGVSKLTGLVRRPKIPLRSDPEPYPLPPLQPDPPLPPQGSRRMSLRGRDRSGYSYSFDFDEESFAEAGGALCLGRNRDLADFALRQDSVSRRHAVLVLRGGAVHLEDRNSGNGTQVNGREVGTEGVALRSGDRLTLGEAELVYDERG